MRKELIIFNWKNLKEYKDLRLFCAASMMRTFRNTYLKNITSWYNHKEKKTYVEAEYELAEDGDDKWYLYNMALILTALDIKIKTEELEQIFLCVLTGQDPDRKIKNYRRRNHESSSN